MLIHFTKKALLALFAFLAAFVAQICHLLIMQAMFWPVISATSVHFCLLIVSLGAESHRKWPRTYFSDLPFYVVYSSVSTNSLQISNKKTIHGEFCTRKLSRWEWPGLWAWHLLVYELKYTEMNHIMNRGGGYSLIRA